MRVSIDDEQDGDYCFTNITIHARSRGLVSKMMQSSSENDNSQSSEPALLPVSFPAQNGTW
jgi:hypothetical protein